MDKITNFLNGKKTYIVAAITGVTAVVQALGYTIPDFVYVLEGALGLGAIRISIAKVGA